MYGAVPHNEEEAAVAVGGGHVERDANVIPNGLIRFLEGADVTVVERNDGGVIVMDDDEDQDCTGEQEEQQETTPMKRRPRPVIIKIAPESCRFMTYMFFIVMVTCAILMTHFVTAPILLQGPPVSSSSSSTGTGSTCPPYDDGIGFDIENDSHLQRIFGYNNICVYWDYSPSREITAMIYPLFEYHLLMYLVVDFTVIVLSYKRGYVSESFFTFVKFVFPITIVLCAWFRMIFINIAYMNVRTHTAAFLGLQIALMLVAIQNTYFILETNKTYPLYLCGASLSKTKYLARLYLYCSLFFGICKLYFDGSLVLANYFPDIAKADSIILPGMTIGQIIDLFWMLFFAVIPIFISYIRAKSETPLIITIDMAKMISTTETTTTTTTETTTTVTETAEVSLVDPQQSSDGSTTE